MTIRIIAVIVLCLGVVIGATADSSVECRRPAVHPAVFVER